MQSWRESGSSSSSRPAAQSFAYDLCKPSIRWSSASNLRRMRLQSRIVLMTSKARACPFKRMTPEQNSS